MAVSKPPQPPDGGFGWVVVIASFLNIFLMTSCVLTFAVLLVEFVQVFNVGMTQLSLLGNMELGFSFIFSKLIDLLIDF